MQYISGLVPLYILLYIITFVLGACIASFLNVVIYRLPRKMDFVRGRSECPSCGHLLSGTDMVPVFSYLALGRKCRYCSAPISPRYALVEALGGLLAVGSVAVYGLSFATVAVFALLAGLLAVAFIDIDTMEIPNGLIVYLLVPAAALVFLLPGVSILSHIIGFFVVSVPLLLITMVVKDGFGGGDIKLMAACGLALGWQRTLLSFFIAALLGGSYGIYLLATRKDRSQRHMVFGQFLSLGVAVSLLFGGEMLSWYMMLSWYLGSLF